MFWILLDMKYIEKAKVEDNIKTIRIDNEVNKILFKKDLVNNWLDLEKIFLKKTLLKCIV